MSLGVIGATLLVVVIFIALKGDHQWKLAEFQLEVLCMNEIGGNRVGERMKVAALGICLEFVRKHIRLTKEA